MKKLMILAAIAASTVAFADCEIPQGGPVANCAEVYDVVLNVKTTECKCQATKTKVTSSSCGITTTTPGAIKCLSWRQIVSKKVEGVIFSCVCSCTTDNDGNNLDGAFFAPAKWDGAIASPMTGNQYFWITKDKIVLPDADLLTIKHIARIGKTKAQVEAAGTFGDGINLAGTGAFDEKTGRVKNLSGSVAGVWTAPLDCDPDAQQGDVCPAWDLCHPTLVSATADKTFVAGTFTIKYNATKSKALASNANNMWGKVVPVKVAQYDLATWYDSIAL
jgi:hypothetical protein